MKILVTGGLGYIGSHTTVELYENGFEAVIIDNLSNSKEEVHEVLEKIVGKKIPFYKGDVCDKKLLKEIFEKEKIDGVIHFAGYKAVGESVSNPLKYYRNNLDSTLSLLEIMEEYKVYNIVFSSSATVYGSPKELPIKETSEVKPFNPYGRTKAFIEDILTDLYNANNNFNITILRYFNPIGAIKSGLIGENPNDIPNNLMPYIVKVANRELECLSIFGNDYDTVDGTGVRDYIHVVDLARGHIKAIQHVLNNTGVDEFNLGTGHGYSVLELVNTFMKVNGVDVPYKITDRRPGDIDACYADVSKAHDTLGFEAIYDVNDMCRDAYNFILHTKGE